MPFANIQRQHVETIWEGDVKEFSRAFDLICIIDQIHEYAAKNHRAFVMKHLEAWHARHEKSLKAKELFFHATYTGNDTSEDMELSGSDEANWDTDSSSGDSDSSSESCDFRDLIGLLGSHSGVPKWLDLKEESKMTRQDKARQTRERNKKLREFTRSRGIGNNPLVGKRGRGRPPKSQVTKEEAPKRGRGRPPKTSSAPLKEAKGDTRITRRSTRTRATTGKQS